jgi:hypothetical protein
LPALIEKVLLLRTVLRLKVQDGLSSLPGHRMPSRACASLPCLSPCRRVISSCVCVHVDPGAEVECACAAGGRVCVCGRRSGVRVQQEVGCACAAGGRVCVCGRRSGVRVQQEVGCACAAGGRVCVCSRRSGVRVQQEVGCACAAGGRVCVCSRRSGVRVQQEVGCACAAAWRFRIWGRGQVFCWGERRQRFRRTKMV